MIARLLNCILYAFIGFLFAHAIDKMFFIPEINVISLITSPLFGYLGFRIYTYWKTPAGKAFYLGIPFITLWVHSIYVSMDAVLLFLFG
jgi:hypothetical protein